ncbi:MAG: putative ATPase [Cyclobacteriaceae bacterium]|jgi:predicted ATPase
MRIKNMQEAHERVSEFLLGVKSQRKEEFTFTFRKSNHANRLEEGYWFYGKENQVIVSFWSGMDWNRGVPNISWVLDKEGQSSLEFNVSDSAFKQDLVQKHFKSEIEQLYGDGLYFQKRYDFLDQDDYIKQLDHFLNNDKKLIDDILLEYGQREDKRRISENEIGFISEQEFNNRLENVNKYKKIREEFDQTRSNQDSKFRPGKVRSINFYDFGTLRNLNIDFDQKDNQWVFFTGENGSGKTSLLRAIAIVLGKKKPTKSEWKNYSPNFDLKLVDRDRVYDHGKLESNDMNVPFVQSLAMYGPFRLEVVTNRIGVRSFYEKLLLNNSFDSLFKSGTRLLSIDRQLKFWSTGNINERELLNKRSYYIKTVFTEVIPELVDVRLSQINEGGTKYVFRNSKNEKEHSSKWNQLSSGYKSSLAMLGDILIRLYNQQPDVLDISELRGVVIIDEIDLHLHPNAQRQLVTNLSKTFPKVQFLVSTHSPIPILGAPKKSLIFNVKWDGEGVIVDRLDKIDFQNMLPNVMLTSPIFGMDKLTPESNENRSEIMVDDDYDDYTFFKEVEKKIDELSKKIND